MSFYPSPPSDMDLSYGRLVRNATPSQNGPQSETGITRTSLAEGVQDCRVDERTDSGQVDPDRYLSQEFSGQKHMVDHHRYISQGYSSQGLIKDAFSQENNSREMQNGQFHIPQNQQVGATGSNVRPNTRQQTSETGHDVGYGQIRPRNARSGSRPGTSASMQGSMMARSPSAHLPVNKSTKHIPCKFFSSGQCAAGDTCQFLHSFDVRQHHQPCKYFAKGNCKYGAKCALAHYLPDGQRVTRADLERPFMLAAQQRQQAPPMHPFPFSPFPMPALAQSFGRPPVQHIPYPTPPPAALPSNELFGQSRDPLFPFEDDQQLATTQSPPERFPSALNAPLPQSYNNSVPNIAKFGPHGSSVPTGFGVHTPLSKSLNTPGFLCGTSKQESRPQESLTATTLLPNSPTGLASTNGPGVFSKTIQAQRLASRALPVSVSVPATRIQSGFADASDLLPSDMFEEALAPNERILKSRLQEHDEIALVQPTFGRPIPRSSSSALGSSPLTGSPSRYQALFEQQRRERGLSNNSMIGSPLRDSWMPEANTQAGAAQAFSKMSIADNHSTLARQIPMVANLRGSTFGRPVNEAMISSPALNPRRIDEELEAGLFAMDDESPRRSLEATTGLNARSSNISFGAISSGRPSFGTLQDGKSVAIPIKK